MPDEGTQAAPEEIQDTPVPEAASQEETPAAESTEDSTPASSDYEGRYNNLRSEFDRRNALLTAAEGNQGPEAQAQALRQLGVEVEMAQEEQDDDEWVDPDDRIDALEQRLAQKEEAEKEAHFNELETEFIDSQLGKLAEEQNVTLSAKEKKIVENNAKANRFDNHEPDLKGAFDDLLGIKSAAREEYLASKKAPRAPVGTAGEQKIDLSDPDARRKYQAEIMDAEGSD